MKINYISSLTLPVNGRFLLATLLSLFVSVVTLLSQNPNLAQHSYRDYGGKIVHYQGNLYYAVYVNMPLIDSAFICSVNSKSKGRFRKLIQKHEATAILDIKVTLDGNIAILGYHEPCDYLDNNSQYFFMKIDTNGNTLIDKSFGALTGLTRNGRLFQDKDSSFVAMTSDKIYYLNKSGQQVSSWNSGGADIFTMFRTPNKESIISLQTLSSKDLLHIDDFGFPINKVSVPYMARSIERFSSGSLILLLTNGSVIKLDSSFSTLSSFSVTPGSIISTMAQQRDTLYLAGEAPLGKPFLIVCDSAMNIISQFTCTSESMAVKSIAPVKALEAAMVIDHGLPVSIHTDIIKTSNNGVFYYAKDIGVTNVFISGSYITNNSLYINLNYNSVVTVKNFGIDTVHSFYLNAHLSTIPGCRPYFYHILVKSIVLPPQGTITVNTGFISQVVDIASSPPKPFYQLANICFYTSAPNFESDAVRSNDGFCLPTQTILVTAISEDLYLSDLKIFPNPFSDVINLDEIHSEKEVRIYDLSGRQMFEAKLSPEQNQIRPSLPSGAYIVEIYSDKNHTMRKLFRE